MEFKQIGAANHFVKFAKSQFGHILSYFLGDKAHEVDDILGFPHEFFAESGILGGYADRARVEVAHSHHNAP
ncbi:hypothetical protein HRbin36_00916 [bacterium HR36]|nr:hypothetical protein HRbin36_00916 [bacterium HR36]